MSSHTRHPSADPCQPFAADLSALVDGEVDDTVARRLVIHLEICEPCHSFFRTIRAMASAHRDVATIAAGAFGGAPAEGESNELLLTEGRRRLAARVIGRRVFRRFAAVLYRLGKTYLLISSNREYRTEVFRQPVAVDAAAVRGKGLVRRILARGEGKYAGYDWVEAGRLLDSTLGSSADLRERSRTMLEEALRLRPNFAEARLYLGFYYKLKGDLDRAEREFARVLDTARSPENRGHAGAQLVTIHEERGDYDAAIRVIERLLARRLPEHDPRFYFTYFNLAVIRAQRSEFDLAAEALATLARRFPDRMLEVRSKLSTCEPLRDAFERQPEFRAHLERRIPALFVQSN